MKTDHFWLYFFQKSKMKFALLVQSVFAVELVDKARSLIRRVGADGDRELSAPELADWLEKSAAHERKLISLDIVSKTSDLYLQRGRVYLRVSANLLFSCANMI